jgi:hypothetical protein
MCVLLVDVQADLFIGLNIGWPDEFKKICHQVAAIFNFNIAGLLKGINLPTPDCAFKLKYETKWHLIMLSPFILGALVVVISVAIAWCKILWGWVTGLKCRCQGVSACRLPATPVWITTCVMNRHETRVLCCCCWRTAPPQESLTSELLDVESADKSDGQIHQSVDDAGLEVPDSDGAGSLELVDPAVGLSRPTSPLNLPVRMQGGSELDADLSRPVSPELSSGAQGSDISDTGEILAQLKKDYKTTNEKTQKKTLKKKYLIAKHFVHLDVDCRGKLGQDQIAELIRKDFPHLGEDLHVAALKTMVSGNDSTANEVALVDFMRWWEAEHDKKLNYASDRPNHAREPEPEPEPEQQLELQPQLELEPEPEPDYESGSDPEPEPEYTTIANSNKSQTSPPPTLWIRLKLTISDASMWMNVQKVVLGYLMIGYVFLSGTALDPLSCAPDGDGDPRLYMGADPSQECDLCDKEYNSLRIQAIVLATLYGFGPPLIFVVVLYSHRDMLKKNEFQAGFGFLSTKMRFVPAPTPMYTHLSSGGDLTRLRAAAWQGGVLSMGGRNIVPQTTASLWHEAL